VGDPFEVAEPHRQHGLGAVERLNLALLVDRQNDGVIGRVQVEADHIAYLFDEEGIGGELETLAAMRLQREELKDPMDGGFGQAVGFGGEPDGPVRAGRRPLPDGAAQEHGHLFVGHRARAARADLIVKAWQAMHEKALPPLAHGRLRPAKTLSDLLVGKAFSGQQDKLGTRDQRMRQAARSGKNGQFFPFPRSQNQGA
jgi:hypothetical protein